MCLPYECGAQAVSSFAISSRSYRGGVSCNARIRFHRRHARELEASIHGGAVEVAERDQSCLLPPPLCWIQGH